jgi:hypothetical protein
MALRIVSFHVSGVVLVSMSAISSRTSDTTISATPSSSASLLATW